MPSLPKDPSRPITEDERDSAVRRLQEAYGDGHVPHEEMDERIHRVLTVTTHGALVAAVASLPPQKPDTSATIAVAAGRIRRDGAWRVPRTLKVESAFGRVHLDLSRAVVEHSSIDIELRLGSGNARITVPRGAVVDIEDLHCVWKDPHVGVPRHSTQGAPRIRVSGTMEYGRLKVRWARR
ncbi:DUF1707 domain-containing protein [Streptomyces sp. NBC_00083]|uniref:DUF1707 SHOCT-like domain-containing protein n=1 Tax=Streptomyces sp. NBC_00083 TaxID=2975647 RepID=UPI002250DCA7|nr:DUF1707 domain-containing protein [Streptomyces sp. NBC_00083]MCX5384325.1 DUF1707 domain-containing protein [Streptomyces sp. NBC_00083]